MRVSTCAIQNNMPKIKGKYLIFKSSIAEIKIHLFVNNKSEVKLIDKFFIHINKISTFKLEKSINLALKNGKVAQKLIKKSLLI